MTPVPEREPELSLHELRPATRVSEEEIVEALSANPPRLPSRLFYDERGSRLFNEICELPEYYLTRTEVAIMERYAAEMGAALGPRCALIELGSGSALKTRVLIEHLPDPAAYVPVDISAEQLLAGAEDLAASFPGLAVHPVAADFTRDFTLPSLSPPPRRRAVYFPGSTLGNFSPQESLRLFERIASLVGPGGALLLGVDLRKDRVVLHRAYNDGLGVTARFNLNILRVLDRELGTGFDPEGWQHRAFYDEREHRIEMHLVSKKDQAVKIGGRTIRFREGDTIHTENSYKFDVGELGELAGGAGLVVERVWKDDRDYFAVMLFGVKRESRDQGKG